ncbi:class I SAM-dependent methyltransferase [Kribbella pittospori]|uniref:Class I SAM-dependent methyltransferase n=1 Tax=Kribbella pittospori TaxID=722689 RepID=A0A4R0JYR3_9ACTN|nr:class I SAM-dependent methyltransferase [Kribbella pittospori]TCC50516.1 class I SAM-dependent methyltransferase [Kribbella pittospori]
MSEVVAHYEQLLAQYYTWMLGADFDALVAEQRDLLKSCGISKSGVALDLGCGSGLHSVALAQLGYNSVLAVDVSPTLLAELATRAVQFPGIRPIHADLCAGLRPIVEPQSITTAVCMGDTLSHLPDLPAVQRLLADSFEALIPGGVLILSFRDLTKPVTGLDRFIQVRADDSRIMTCFLEDEGDYLRVHDLIHSRTPDSSWQLNKSSYRKLRIPPTWLTTQLRDTGFTVASSVPGPRGMLVVTAFRR